MKHQIRIINVKIFSSGKEVYNQIFFPGVNIIAGENSTGKSTILEFIAYGLGYEELSWKEAQKKCDFVQLKVELSGHEIEIKREINDKKQNPFHVRDANGAAAWTVLPYRKFKDKKGFSNHIFDILGYPQSKVDESTALTTNQLLRLIYADQTSPTDSLFNTQKEFDNKGIRKAVFEFLMGIDDQESHSIRQYILELERKYSESHGEVLAIRKFLTRNGESLDENKVEDNRRGFETEIRALELKNTEIAKSGATPGGLENEFKAMFFDLKKRNLDVEEELRRLKLEKYDSEELIRIIERDINNITEAEVMYNVFSGMEFIYCPQCLSKLPPSSSHENHCNLCKLPYEGEEVKQFYFERKKEAEFQVVESKSLIKKRSEEIERLNATHERVLSEISAIQNQMSEYEKISNSAAKEIDANARRIGWLRAEIDSLERSTKLLKQIETRQNQVSQIKVRIEGLRNRLGILEESRESYANDLFLKISRTCLSIIKSDGNYEAAFTTAREVIVNYPENRTMVDGANKFAASSEAVLKLAIRFTLFYMSLEMERVRYPRFAILDCMEDKGMITQRAHVIQNFLLDLCDQHDSDDYQLIFATAAPSDRILKSGKLVGKFMKKGEHTLEFKK